MTYYSIEWIRKDDIWKCWNQHALTHRRWLVRLYQLEMRLQHRARDHYFRVREV